MEMEEAAKRFTGWLEVITTEICTLEGINKDLKMVLHFLLNKEAPDSLIKITKTELYVIQCSMKVKIDRKALIIFMLNADVISYKKRIKQFKRHLHEYLDCFLDLEIYKVGDNSVFIENFSPFGVVARMKEIGSEEFYRQFCISQQEHYNFFCDKYVEWLISNFHWRRCRGKC